MRANRMLAALREAQRQAAQTQEVSVVVSP